MSLIFEDFETRSLPRLPRKSSQKKPPGHFPEPSLTVDFKSNPEVRLKFPSSWRHQNGHQNKRVPKRQVFKAQKTWLFDTPSVFILFWVLQKRHPDGYQNKRVPKCLVPQSPDLPLPHGLAPSETMV